MQTNKLHVPIFHRNLPILSLAVSLAAQERADALALSVIQDDFDKAYPSASKPFLQAFAQLAETLEPNLIIEYPLWFLSKIEVLKTAKDLGISLEQTYTCMRGSEVPCGTCMQCKSRKAAEDLLSKE